MNSIADFKRRAVEAESRAEHLHSLLESFFTGDIPVNGSIDHHILGKWGRKRLEEMKSQPSLLRQG